MKKVVVAYVPVLHAGYLGFFKRHTDAEGVFVFGKTLIKRFDVLAKEIRQIEPGLVRQALERWGIAKKVEVLEEKDIKTVSADEIVMPDEDVCRELAGEYFSDKKVVFDGVFLRWDKHKSMEEKPVQVDQTISKSDSDRSVIALLRKESEKSSDWWRHIGAAIIDNGNIVSVTHNHTVPAKHLHYVDGDPRNNFHKGVHVELSTIFHAEAALIAKAAQEGRSLSGSSMYVTTFPCPPCAKLIAYSGIKELYYADGYGVLDGEKVLRSQGVKIIHVE